MIVYTQVESCPETALDGFRRHQNVTECWRRLGPTYQLVPCPFVDDWTPQRKREKVQQMLGTRNITYGAFDGSRIIGLVVLNKALNGNRMILDSLQVSEEYRHQGIGRKLFTLAMDTGRAAGAESLYISACSSREPIAFYRAMGCELARQVIPELAEDEPWDLQLERRL